MYLRGHLKCVKCGGNLTGSASTSKTGAATTKEFELYV